MILTKMFVLFVNHLWSSTANTFGALITDNWVVPPFFEWWPMRLLYRVETNSGILLVDLLDGFLHRLSFVLKKLLLNFLQQGLPRAYLTANTVKSMFAWAKWLSRIVIINQINFIFRTRDHLRDVLNHYGFTSSTFREIQFIVVFIYGFNEAS